MMTEGSALNLNTSFFQSLSQKSIDSEVFDLPIITRKQKQDEPSQQLKMKNMLESQLTQENSGISYAFKAHLLILTFERIKLRKIAKIFSDLKGGNGTVQIRKILAAGIQKQVKNQTGNQLVNKQMVVDTQPSRNQSYNVNESSELPLFGFLQQINLKSSHKFLSKELFQNKVKANQYEKKIENLQRDLLQAQRRQERQMIKKRESLESLAQELGQKNQVIQELKSIVKGLKVRLNSKQNGSGFILEEDSDSLRRSLLHMEGVNDRLNYDLAKMRQGQKLLIDQMRALTSQNQKLKNEVCKLREQVFAADSLKDQVELSRKECAIWERRLKSREERLNILQKRINEQSRSKAGQSSHFGQNYLAFCTEKRFENMNSSLTNGQSFKESEYISKNQAIFGFLFHIEDPKYTLHSIELFDSQQKQFLQSQKVKIMNMLQSTNKSQCLPLIKSKKLQEQYQIANDFGCTILQIIEKQSMKAEPNQQKDQKAQLEINRLREKISQLKDSQLFVRSVLLSFLKSLQLRSIKKQSQNILELLYEVFEYSEEERRSIFQTKSRKIFGFI